MGTPPTRPARRTDSLTRAVIIGAAREILDAKGEAGLTFRALTSRLSTGAGAIYWHIADKAELLAATTDDVIAQVVSAVNIAASPREVIRDIALGLFDAIDEHPWVGAQLARSPWASAMLTIVEGFGVQLRALGAPEPTLFDSTTALTSYVLGVAGQNAANARLAAPGQDRAGTLNAAADQWAALDEARYPFLRSVADRMRDHDDRDQFLAGVDLFLAGVDALR